MNKKTLMILILTMVTLALTLPLASASDWTQFHCDAEHSGHSTSNAPVTNHTTWISDDLGADFPSSLTVANGQVFVYCGDQLISLCEYTGTVLWNVSVNETPNVCGSWVTPVYHDERVFLSANETCCFDALDGYLIWTFAPPTGKGAVNGGCAVTEGMVFTSDWDGSHYYCLSESEGTEIWNFTVDGNAQSTPAVSVADDQVFFGSCACIGEAGGVAYCVNMATGAEIWNFTADNPICGSITIGDGVVYFTGCNFYGDGALYALYSENGTVKWNKTVKRTNSTPALVDGRLYISGGYGGINNKFTDLLTYCFDASTGDLIWNTSVADEIGDWKCSPAYADGMVFAGRPKPNGTDFKGTYALNASTGEVVWSYPDGGASPAISDGVVFTIGSGRVYAFGPTTLWRGDLPLGSGTFNVTAESGVNYTINRTCALASIIEAAEVGGLDCTINDSWYDSYGTIYVAEIDGVSDWMYWVNYPDDPSPTVGANTYELADGDTVTWYHADSMDSTPADTDMLIRIGVFTVVAPGDVDHDGSITTADAIIALQMAVGAIPPNGEADVDHDGVVTSLDSMMIMQVASGAIII